MNPKDLGQMILPVLLAVLNAGFVAVWLLYLEPEASDLESRLNNFERSTRQLRIVLSNKSSQLESMAKLGEQYEVLVERGFLEPQDRLGTSKLFDRLRTEYGLRTIQFRIAPERVFNNPSLRQKGFTIVSSTMTVTMTGLLDTDLIEFCRGVMDEFPGQVRLKSLSLAKQATPDDETLATLRDGQLVDFVAGAAVFEWRTLNPLDSKTAQQT